MAGLWYRVGTVSVTNGSKKVTGFGTKWKTSVAKPDKGHPVHAPDGRIYELDYVESDTVLWLVNSYAGATAADQAYAIDIARSGTNSAFSRDLSAFVAYNQSQMDGWQQLLTGTGDVTLTAPDGTKKTVPSWDKVMNAGYGVVAQAMTEADRAKQEAQKAAASADEAGNSTVAAALPLPDVWAPLSDSLRLITGYGRDVLVGGDVVASMVNFSRSTAKVYQAKDGHLKVAAVNEPAFELGGLLLEGSSTNQIAIHDEPSLAVKCAWDSFVTSPMPLKNASVYRALEAGPASAPYVQFGSLNAAPSTDSKTASVWVMAISRPLTFTIDCEGAAEKEFSVPVGVWQRLSTTRVATGQGYSGFFKIGLKLGTGIVGDKFAVWGGQLEALPFASSLIMTSGAAATRAQDICWIPVENNGKHGMDNEKTISMVSDMLGSSGSFNFILATPWGAFDYSKDYERVSSTNLEIRWGSPASTLTPVRKVARFTKNGGCSALFGMEQKDGPSGDWSLPNTRIEIGSYNSAGAFPHYGHVRDLKIWLKPLRDQQMKAIA